MHLLHVESHLTNNGIDGWRSCRQQGLDEYFYSTMKRLKLIIKKKKKRKTYFEVLLFRRMVSSESSSARLVRAAEK